MQSKGFIPSSIDGNLGGASSEAFLWSNLCGGVSAVEILVSVSYSWIAKQLGLEKVEASDLYSSSDGNDQNHWNHKPSFEPTNMRGVGGTNCFKEKLLINYRGGEKECQVAQGLVEKAKLSKGKSILLKNAQEKPLGPYNLKAKLILDKPRADQEEWDSESWSTSVEDREEGQFIGETSKGQNFVGGNYFIDLGYGST
ncbi:hypothetical protein QYF36_017240 [Acer negundo]|nr:hypothetical protein QYF36_017240 [Acer negundo]